MARIVGDGHRLGDEARPELAGLEGRLEGIPGFAAWKTMSVMSVSAGPPRKSVSCVTVSVAKSSLPIWLLDGVNAVSPPPYLSHRCFERISRLKRWNLRQELPIVLVHQNCRRAAAQSAVAARPMPPCIRSALSTMHPGTAAFCAAG